MLDYADIQTKAVTLLASVTALNGASVEKDDGYSNTDVERALRDDGFCVVVRLTTSIDAAEQAGAKMFGLGQTIIHLLENPHRNPETTGKKVSMSLAIAGVISALSANDSEGERHFRITSVQLVNASPGLLEYEITAICPTSGN